MLIVGLVSLVNEIGVVSVVSIVVVVYVGYEVGLVSAIIIITIIIIIIIIIITKTLLTCPVPNVHGVQTNCGHLPYLFHQPPWALIEFLDLESGRLFEEGAY